MELGFVILTVCVTFLVSLLWVTKFYRMAAIGIVLAIGCYVGAGLWWTDGLSRPKPFHVETEEVEEAKVLWVGGETNRNIVLLLSWPKSDGPRLYKYPWSDNLALTLQKMQSESKATNRPVMIRKPFDGLKFVPTGDRPTGRRGHLTPDNESNIQKLYLAPPPALPEKYGDE